MIPFAGGFLAFDSTDTWVLVAFIAFIGLLIYMGAFGFIGRALDARANRIRAQLEEARGLREAAQRKLAEFERKAEEADRETREIVEKARRDAEASAEEAKRAIEASVAQRLQSAEDQIAAAEAAAVRRVRNDAVDSAVNAASAVLRAAPAGAAATDAMEAAVRDVTARLQ